jgi:hypothetical protein
MARSRPRAAGGMEIGMGLVETAPLSAALTDYPISEAVDGTPLGVAIDAQLIDDPTTLRDNDGQVRYAIAFLSEDSTVNRYLTVFGGVVCAGYPNH